MAPERRHAVLLARVGALNRFWVTHTGHTLKQDARRDRGGAFSDHPSDRIGSRWNTIRLTCTDIARNTRIQAPKANTVPRFRSCPGATAYIPK